jgi:hypothetical protein
MRLIVEHLKVQMIKLKKEQALMPGDHMSIKA